MIRRGSEKYDELHCSAADAVDFVEGGVCGAKRRKQGEEEEEGGALASFRAQAL